MIAYQSSQVTGKKRAFVSANFVHTPVGSADRDRMIVAFSRRFLYPMHMVPGASVGVSFWKRVNFISNVSNVVSSIFYIVFKS